MLFVKTRECERHFNFMKGVPGSKKVGNLCYKAIIVDWTNVCLSAHAIAQPCEHATSEAFQAVKGLWNIYIYICI